MQDQIPTTTAQQPQGGTNPGPPVPPDTQTVSGELRAGLESVLRQADDAYYGGEPLELFGAPLPYDHLVDAIFTAGWRPPVPAAHLDELTDRAARVLTEHEGASLIDLQKALTAAGVLPARELRAELATAREDLTRARSDVEFHNGIRMEVERVLDEALGTEEEDGAGAGLVGDVALLADRLKAAREDLEKFVAASLETDYTVDHDGGTECANDAEDRAAALANIVEMHRLLLVRAERLFAAYADARVRQARIDAALALLDAQPDNAAVRVGELRHALLGDPQPATLVDKITDSKAIVDALKAGTAIVCLTKCQACMHADHFDTPQWHTWADDDDIEHAKNTGQPDPRESRCGCWCANAERSTPVHKDVVSGD